MKTTHRSMPQGHGKVAFSFLKKCHQRAETVFYFFRFLSFHVIQFLFSCKHLRKADNHLETNKLQCKINQQLTTLQFPLSFRKRSAQLGKFCQYYLVAIQANTTFLATLYVACLNYSNTTLDRIVYWFTSRLSAS